jgi:hypothetical protein
MKVLNLIFHLKNKIKTYLHIIIKWLVSLNLHILINLLKKKKNFKNNFILLNKYEFLKIKMEYIILFRKVPLFDVIIDTTSVYNC